MTIIKRFPRPRGIGGTTIEWDEEVECPHCGEHYIRRRSEGCFHNKVDPRRCPSCGWHYYHTSGETTNDEEDVVIVGVHNHGRLHIHVYADNSPESWDEGNNSPIIPFNYSLMDETPYFRIVLDDIRVVTKPRGEAE